MTRASCFLGVSRRALLAGFAGGALLAALPSTLSAADQRSGSVFLHGVASGDPDASSVVLWTRVTGAGPVEVRWELCEDASFRRIIAKGVVATDADHDYTVKVLADALEPGRTYHYRFHAAGATSPVGRTRTLPVGHVDRLGIALASCSNYAFGLFNAYDAIARDPQVEFVLHTGDYIYEYGGPKSWGTQTAEKLGRVHQPQREIVSLADYRERHAQYKTDPGLQAMHAAHPLLACWDDHESTNNPWVGGAQNHQSASEGDWQTRRAASIRAYFEWMPVREPGIGKTRAQFWRHYSFGDLAMLHTLETRHTARAKQVEYADYLPQLLAKDSVARFRAEILGAPDRPILAAELETELEEAIADSVRKAQPWRLIGSPMLIARIEVPDLAANGLLPDILPRLLAAGPDELRSILKDPAAEFAWKGRFGLPDFTDAWGGYPWARQRLYELSQRAGAQDLVFLSGDSHSFWANELVDDTGQPMGVEFGTSGITSPGDFIGSGFDRETALRLDRAYSDLIPEVRWTDDLHNGYVRLDLTHESGRAYFVAVDTILTSKYRSQIIKAFDISRKNGSRKLVPVSAISTFGAAD